MKDSLTSLGVQGTVVVHVSIAKGAAGDSVTADADRGDGADLLVDTDSAVGWTQMLIAWVGGMRAEYISAAREK